MAFENHLSGSVPNLSGLTAMQDLDFSFNSDLTGPFPTWLAPSQPAIPYLRVTGLNGPLPPGLGNLTTLQELVIYDTQWTGTIPQALLDKAEARRLVLDNRRPVPPSVEEQHIINKGRRSRTRSPSPTPTAIPSLQCHASRRHAPAGVADDGCGNRHPQRHPTGLREDRSNRDGHRRYPRAPC